MGVTGYVSPLGTITVPDEAPFAVDANLVPLNATVSGRVTGLQRDGAPDLGPCLGSRCRESDQTDANGYYSIDGLPAGTVGVCLGGNYTPWVAVTTDVTVVANTVVTQDFQLELRTTSTVFGNVFPAPDAPGLDDICVQLLDADTGEPLGSTTSYAYAEPTYVLENVESGDYTIWFEDCDPTRVPQRASAYLGGGQEFAAAIRFTVNGPADDQMVDDTYLVEVAEPPGSITISVTDGDRRPGHRRLRPYYNGSGWTGSLTTRRWHLHALGSPFGTYQVSVQAPGFHGSVTAPA